MAAFIRQYFGKDPYKLSEEEFTKLAVEALFIKDFDRRQMEKAMMNVLEQRQSPI